MDGVSERAGGWGERSERVGGGRVSEQAGGWGG